MPDDTASPVFRDRVSAGEALVGTFVKTSSHQVVEVLGRTSLDFVVIDAEHAPFDRTALDLCLLAARATRMPALVRLQNPAPDTILGVLDMGADGLMVPHVRDAAMAAEVVAAARYRGGGRGFSPSGRAGDYGGVSMADHLERSDRSVTILAQIEDLPGVDNAEAIGRVEGIDCLFIGRADLAVALDKTSVGDPAVSAAVEKICAAGRAAGTAVGVFLADPAEAADFRRAGASLFVIRSDQGFLKAAAEDAARAFAGAVA